MAAGMTRRPSASQGPAAILFLFIAFGMPTASAGDLLNFERFKGRWTGSGAFIYGDGHKDPANCRANVQSYGRPDRGGIELTCVGGQTDISGRAYDVTLKGTKVSGSWEWPAFGVTGVLGGQVTEASFDVVLHPQTLIFSAFTAHFVVSVPGGCAASAIATIDAPTFLRQATMSLHRC